MRKVLIIDGDREFLGMAESFLSASNFKVLAAVSMDEAHAQLQSAEPDLVLLSRDLLSSSGRLCPDGLDVLRDMKSHGEWKNIPVILLVSEASEQDLERLRLLKFKAEDYACKPIADNDLLRRVENLIGFDQDETKRAFIDEEESATIDRMVAGDNPELAEAAQKEIQEMLTRLGQEVVGKMKGQEPAATRGGASHEHLRSEFDLLQKKLREQEKRFEKISEKSKKAIGVLEERNKDLSAENRELKETLESIESEFKSSSEDRYNLMNFIEKARELLHRFENHKKELEHDADKAKKLISELDSFKK